MHCAMKYVKFSKSLNGSSLAFSLLYQYSPSPSFSLWRMYQWEILREKSGWFSGDLLWTCWIHQSAQQLKFSRRTCNNRAFIHLPAYFNPPNLKGSLLSLRLVLDVGKFLLIVSVRSCQVVWNCFTPTPGCGTQWMIKITYWVNK